MGFGLPAGGQERPAEGLIKVVAAIEISAGVLVGFRQQAILDHVEDDFAEVVTLMNAPFLKDSHGHGAELAEGEAADAPEQFLPADMADAAAVFPADAFLGVVQRLANELVGVAGIARVFGPDYLERFIETDFVHIKALLVWPLVPGGARYDTL